jgi:hypothetical protein
MNINHKARKAIVFFILNSVLIQSKYTQKNKNLHRLLPPLPPWRGIEIHEDNFANVPEINIVWPAPESYNKDMYPLDFLAQILSQGKKAPFAFYNTFLNEAGTVTRIKDKRYCGMTVSCLRPGCPGLRRTKDGMAVRRCDSLPRTFISLSYSWKQHNNPDRL